jgi:hypothetical protein
MSTENVSIVVPASLSHSGKSYRRDSQIDVEVADLVRRLNHPANGDEPVTSASCGGHGTAPASISLVDGCALVVAQTEGDVSVMALALGFDVRQSTGRLFRLVRHADPTGVSGTGHVADGWLFDAVAVVRWRGQHPTTTVHHGGMESVEAIHGHNGQTVVEWIE